MSGDYVKRFNKELERAARNEGRRLYDAFGEWLETAFLAVSAPVWKLVDQEKHAAGEARYAAIVARHRDQETISCYSRLLAILVEALETERRDVLSALFMDIAANDHIGQVFTPWELCTVMAEMTCSDGESLLAQARAKGRDYITCHEPAAGAGGMILATSAVFARQGIDPARRQHWVAVDVDVVAVRACYLQMSLMGISGVVIHGNTLTLDEWSATPTLTAVLFPKKERRPTLREVVTDEGKTLSVRIRQRPTKIAAE